MKNTLKLVQIAFLGAALSISAISSNALAQEDALASTGLPVETQEQPQVQSLVSNVLTTTQEGQQIRALTDGSGLAIVNPANGEIRSYSNETRQAGALITTDTNFVIPGFEPPEVFVSNLPPTTNRLRELNNGLQVLGRDEGGLVVQDLETNTFFEVDETSGEYFEVDAITGAVSTIASGSDVTLRDPIETVRIIEPEITRFSNRLRDGTEILDLYGSRGEPLARDIVTGQFFDVDGTTGQFFPIDSVTGFVSPFAAGQDSRLITVKAEDDPSSNILDLVGNITARLPNGDQLRIRSDGLGLSHVNPETGEVSEYFIGDDGVGIIGGILGVDNSLILEDFTRPEILLQGAGFLASGSLRDFELTGDDGITSAFRIVADQNAEGTYYALDAAGNFFGFDTATNTIDFSNANFDASRAIDPTAAGGSRVSQRATFRGGRADFEGVSAAQRASLAGGASCGGGTLGAVICNTTASFQTVPGLLSGFSYLFGIVLGWMGVMKLREHVDSPNQVPIWDPMKRFLAGSAFFSLPVVYNAVRNTINGDSGTILEGSAFNTAGVSAGGLDAMLVRLMADIWGPMQMVFIGFAYLAGVILIMIGISRLLKSEQEGARGPMGIGTIMTFLVAGVLLSLNETLGAAVNSLFQTGAENNAVLGYTQGMSTAAVGHSNAVIGSIMAFVAVLGWISFIRGFFIIRGVAEGNSQASMMAGITHVLGGAIAVNLGGFISAVQTTLGIDSSIGLTISSAEPYITSVTFIV